jgi:endonuclease G
MFQSKDKKFRTIKIPKRFFKIAVWADEDGLRSLGMIADQSKVFDVWPEALFEAEAVDPTALGLEAFQDEDEIDRVDDFLTTIEAIEAATNLDFGEAVRRADVRAGEADTKPRSLDDVPLVPTRRGGAGRKRTRAPRSQLAAVGRAGRGRGPRGGSRAKP